MVRAFVSLFDAPDARDFWHPSAQQAAMQGQWHVQCIDETVEPPESSVFANDEFVPGNPFGLT